MRKILLPFIFCLPLPVEAQVSVGPVVGPYFIDNTQIRTIPRTGLMVGLMADMQLTPYFFIQPGINYVMQRSTVVPEIYSLNFYDNTTIKVQSNSVEIPIILSFKTKQTLHGRFTLSAGGFITFAVSGTTNVKTTTGSVTHSEDYKYTINDKDIRRLNAGGVVNAGYELKNGLFARVFFQKEAMYSSHNYAYGCSVGYFIGKKTISTRKQPDQPGI